MSRLLTEHSTDNIKRLLDCLTESSTATEAYRSAMYQLGLALAPIIGKKAGNGDELVVACTVEDADYLAKGIVDGSEDSEVFSSIRLVCFWNTRVSTGERWTDDNASPIVKRYREPLSKDKHHLLVVVKSIIASGCTVRTNMTNLMSDLHADDNIIIAAPVLLEGADCEIEREFPRYSNRFEFLYFAVDDKTNSLGEVLPGIGGDVYKRLDVTKNIIPEIVKTRRLRFAAAP
jgi:hypothetical protein